MARKDKVNSSQVTIFYCIVILVVLQRKFTALKLVYDSQKNFNLAEENWEDRAAVEIRK